MSSGSASRWTRARGTPAPSTFGPAQIRLRLQRDLPEAIDLEADRPRPDSVPGAARRAPTPAGVVRSPITSPTPTTASDVRHLPLGLTAVTEFAVFACLLERACNAEPADQRIRSENADHGRDHRVTSAFAHRRTSRQYILKVFALPRAPWRVVAC
jgi:hypothetical protein